MAIGNSIGYSGESDVFPVRSGSSINPTPITPSSVDTSSVGNTGDRYIRATGNARTNDPNLQKFVSDNIQGIQDAYDYDTWMHDYPDNEEILGALKVKPFADDGTFIGSLPITYPYTRHLELDPDKTSCEAWELCLPSFNMPEGLNQFLDGLTGKDSITWKTIEEINRLAEQVDTIPEARQLITILSQEYKSLPAQITKKLSPQFKSLVLDYQTTAIPNKEPEYDDLSAYLSAPFPKLKLQEAKDNDELNKLLESLKDLSIEDLDIPIIEPKSKDITERDVGGDGIFDHIASSIFNQLLFARDKQLVTKDDIANIYSQFLVQGIQTATQFALEKNNIVLQSYQAKVAAAQASIAILEAKTKLLMLPSQLRLAYAQIEAQLEQVELLKVQVQLEKEKFPQVVAQTDLILAQTDGQRLQNEQIQVGIQQGKLSLVQTQEQIALMKEQNKQAIIQTETADLQRKAQELNIELQKEQLSQSEEQTKQLVLSNNKLVEDTKMVDAQTQLQLKQVKLADIQAIEAKARIKAMAQQLDKEKEQMGLIKAQIATAYAQLALIKDQMKASRAQYSDTIDGKPVGGLLGAQMMVNKVQASSFERKAFNDMLGNLQQGWAANKTADIAISSPVAYTPIVLDKALTWGLTKYFNMPNDIIKVPADYTPYLTDDQMDAKKPVNYKTLVKESN